MNSFIELLPPLDLELRKRSITKQLDRATMQGITLIGDAYVFGRNLEAWQGLKRNGALKLHVVLFQNGNFGSRECTRISELVARYGGVRSRKKASRLPQRGRLGNRASRVRQPRREGHSQGHLVHPQSISSSGSWSSSAGPEEFLDRPV